MRHGENCRDLGPGKDSAFVTPRVFALAVTAHSNIVNLNLNLNRNVNDTGTAAHVCIDCQSPPLGYIAAMALAVLQGLSISV